MVLNRRAHSFCTVFFDRHNQIDAGILIVEPPKVIPNLHAVRRAFGDMLSRHEYGELPGADVVAARWFIPRWYYTARYWLLGRDIDQAYRTHFGHTLPAYSVRPELDIDLICVEPAYFTLPCLVQGKVEAYEFVLACHAQALLGLGYYLTSGGYGELPH